MDFAAAISNFTHPVILFFFLGIFAVLVKSDLEIPPQVGKFLSLYLLFHIGIKGGWELFREDASGQMLIALLVCVLGSFLVPFLIYGILRKKLDAYDAGGVAAAYGSISAVTFVTAMAYLENKGVDYGGHMIAGMALMESPAIIAGLILIRMNTKAREGVATKSLSESMAPAVKESLVNGSVLMLVGSLVIGYISGADGEDDLTVFVDNIFYGMLTLYMLDMGLLAGARLNELRKSGSFLILFALLFPIVIGTTAIFLCWLLGYSRGDALLQSVLFASASYIAVPAAMRIAEPKVNLSVLLSMSLVVTFTFNVSIGIPLYFSMISALW
ncbi:MAG: sodium-dependent bicarbonate transport family permease [Pseudomonadota bacterium]